MDREFLIKYLKLLLKELGLYLVVEPNILNEEEIKACIKVLELVKKRYNYNFKSSIIKGE